MAEEVVHNVEHVVEEIFSSNPTLHVEYGAPTLDRPFGLALWPLFRYGVFRAFNYDVESFQYEYASSVPLSHVSEVTAAIVGYYAVIFGGRWLLQNVRPIRLDVLNKVHNLILTLLSGLLLVLLIEQLSPIIGRHGVFYAICNTASWQQKIVVIYYLNYLTKYYELVDTVFQVLRKRPLTFLHTYHHGATALLCYTQLNGTTPVSWVPITLNLGVHVVMYFYYFLSSFGVRVWWKHWVTRFQIIQFVIDLGFVYFATYTHFVYNYFPDSGLPHWGNCEGEESAAIHGCLVLSSYLVLFISFYIKSYLAPKVAAAAKRDKIAKDAAHDKEEHEAKRPSSSRSSRKTKETTPASEARPKRQLRSRRA